MSVHILGKNHSNVIFVKFVLLKKGNLSRHEHAHIGEKPFKCKLCEKVFSQNGDLTRQERTHTEGKTFKCKYYQLLSIQFIMNFCKCLVL